MTLQMLKDAYALMHNKEYFTSIGVYARRNIMEALAWAIDEISELQEKLKQTETQQYAVEEYYKDKLHRRNMQIKNLKEEIAKLQKPHLVNSVQKCKNCGEIYTDEVELTRCPRCNSKKIEIL